MALTKLKKALFELEDRKKVNNIQYWEESVELINLYRTIKDDEIIEIWLDGCPVNIRKKIYYK